MFDLPTRLELIRAATAHLETVSWVVHHGLTVEAACLIDVDAWGQAIGTYADNAGIAVDLGAGTGGFSHALQTWGASCVVAMEPSTAMQAEAAPASDVHQVTGRAEAMPLRPGSAGLVWISTALHHFEDPSEAVRECHRVLRERGPRGRPWLRPRTQPARVARAVPRLGEGHQQVPEHR